MSIATTKLPDLNEESISINWSRTTGLITIHLFALLSPWFFSWEALGISLFLYWLCGSIGICLGYHRLLSHRSFQTPKWLEYVIATIGALALQGGPLFWVGTHRMHHAFTEDNEQDPYSANRGFWWSHLLWLVIQKENTFDTKAHCRFAPQLAQNPYYVWLNRYYVLLQIPLGLGLYFLGGWSYVMYGIFVRAVLLWHSTWLINSATHLWGYQSFKSDDNSRNLWWAAVLAFGEGWHNNHHAHPRSAKAGLQWWEIDITWWVIWAFDHLGLAWNVRQPKLERAIANSKSMRR